MTNHIIESIGGWGVKTVPARLRFNDPKAGDLIQFPEELQKYPISHEYCRIQSVNEEKWTASVVNGMGSAFISENGHHDISGGPFFTMNLNDLDPLYMLKAADVWNWGDNLPGAGQGVHYTIYRPVFRAMVHPNDRIKK